MLQQGIHPELERRLVELEKPEMQSAGFGMTDWVWLMAPGVAGPAILLLWGGHEQP